MLIQRLGRPFTTAAAAFLLTLVTLVPLGDALAAAPADGLDVRGVMISRHARSALINGRILREGDRLGDVQVVEIGQQEVLFRNGGSKFGVLVGSSLAAEKIPQSRPAPRIELTQETAVAALMQPIPDPVLSAATPASVTRERQTDVPAQLPGTAVETGSSPQQSADVMQPLPDEDLDVSQRMSHQVRSGDTLSEIAEAYLLPGYSLNQMMVALFERNPGAFGGNINMMRAGVTLEIPTAGALQSAAPEVAMAEVMRQTDSWRSSNPRSNAKETMPVAETYGPVTSGETLSGIAMRLVDRGIEANTLMSVIYEANPHAFGRSMDVLREGTVLRLPAPADVDSRPAEGGPVVAGVARPWPRDPGRTLSSDTALERATASLRESPLPFALPFD